MHQVLIPISALPTVESYRIKVSDRSGPFLGDGIQRTEIAYPPSHFIVFFVHDAGACAPFTFFFGQLVCGDVLVFQLFRCGTVLSQFPSSSSSGVGVLLVEH